MEERSISICTCIIGFVACVYLLKVEFTPLMHVVSSGVPPWLNHMSFGS